MPNKHFKYNQLNILLSLDVSPAPVLPLFFCYVSNVHSVSCLMYQFCTHILQKYTIYIIYINTTSLTVSIKYGCLTMLMPPYMCCVTCIEIYMICFIWITQIYTFLTISQNWLSHYANASLYDPGTRSPPVADHNGPLGSDFCLCHKKLPSSSSSLPSSLSMLSSSSSSPSSLSMQSLWWDKDRHCHHNDIDKFSS